jgi:hypothetical protein
MPLVRYFIFTGTMLLGLLLFLNWYLPGSPAPADSAGIDRSIIRIHSSRKWPEAVKIDTSVPIVATAPAAPDASVAATAPPVAAPAAAALPAGVKNAYASEPSPTHTASTSGRRHTTVARAASTRKARRFASYRQPEWHGWFLASW